MFPPGRLQADLYLGSGRVDARSGQRIECEWSCVGSARLAATRCILRSGCCAAAVFAALLILPATPARAETLPEVLVRTYQGNPLLNAERARLRGIDETVPMAVAAYRPQIMAMLTGGLQAGAGAVSRQHRANGHAAHLDHRAHGVADRCSTASRPRIPCASPEANVRSGREALRNVGQGRAARRGDRLHQRARQPDPGGSPAHQLGRFCARRLAPPASVSMPAT